MTTKTMVLRSLTVNKEQAAVLRVALAAALEKKDLFSEEGRTIARGLAERTDEILDAVLKAEQSNRLAAEQHEVWLATREAKDTSA